MHNRPNNLPTGTISIQCAGAIKQIFCEALSAYVKDILTEHRAGVFGASHQHVTHFIFHLKNTPDNHPLALNTELQRTCISAVHFHYSQIHQKINIPLYEHKQVLLDMLQGEHTCDSQLDQALLRDHHSA